MGRPKTFFTATHDNGGLGFSILVRAEDETDAKRLAEGYGADSDMPGEWEISNRLYLTSDKYNCEYLIQAPEYDEEDGDITYVEDVYETENLYSRASLA